MGVSGPSRPSESTFRCRRISSAQRGCFTRVRLVRKHFKPPGCIPLRDREATKAIVRLDLHNNKQHNIAPFFENKESCFSFHSIFIPPLVP